MKRANLSEKQIAVIVAGKVRGEPNRLIARRAGVCDSVVDHASADHRMGPLITAAKERNRDKLEHAYDQAVDGLIADLSSDFPDVRIRTRSQVLKYIESGEVAAKIADALGGDATFEEVLIAWRRKSAA